MPRTLAWILSALLVAACSPQPAANPQPEADRVKECADLKRAISDELSKLTACENDSQCGKPISAFGSCGCTRGPVGRLDADVTKYEALLARMPEYRDVPGCESRRGTCDCPAMDGAVCTGEPLHCRWKPLDRGTLCARMVDSYFGTRKRECTDGAAQCPAKLIMLSGIAELVIEGKTRRSSYQCSEGNLRFSDPTFLSGNIGADGRLTMFDDIFEPAPGALAVNEPAPAEDDGQPGAFMPASGEINCTYGGPLLICDRSVGHVYERVVLRAEGPGQVAKHPNERSCCSLRPFLPEGARIVRGPFTCENKAGEIICKRQDGHGVAIGGKRARVLHP